MLIVQRTTKTGASFDVAELTYDEETALAEWVLDVLSARWLHEELHKGFRRFLLYIFNKKTKGWDLSVQDLERLAEHVEHIEQSVYYGDLLPPWPNAIKNNGEGILPFRATKKGKLKEKERIEHLKKERRRAWYEVWEDHPARKRVPECQFFGRDNSHYKETQEEMETAFWDRVDEVEQEFGCSRQEAVKEVEDYMPREPQK